MKKNILKSMVAVSLLCSVLNANCVRDNKKEVVNCSESKLMWQDSATVQLLSDELPGFENSKYDKDSTWQEWQSAIDYCENLKFAGYSDWRLPNIYELLSVSVPNSVSKTGWVKGFKYYLKQAKENYWSSTSSDGISNVYMVNKGSETESDTDASDLGLVRCVRGGVK